MACQHAVDVRGLLLRLRLLPPFLGGSQLEHMQPRHCTQMRELVKIAEQREAAAKGTIAKLLESRASM